jgi:hypothetical protein
VGVQTADGVILAVEKRISSVLLEPSSIEKIVEIDSHIGCAMSGLTPDSRIMIDHARVEAQVVSMLYDLTKNLTDLEDRGKKYPHFRWLKESLVYLQRVHQSRVGDASRV